MEEYKPIESITIKNVKGFGDPGTTLHVNIKPNRVNILYAPNGFGKSSITTAFNSLKTHSLDVAKESKHHKDDALDSELSIVYDGKVLSANKNKNDIQPEFTTFVINSRLNPVSVLHNMGKFSTATSYLDINDIVVQNSIPPQANAYYKYNTIKSHFGVSGKVLTNISDILNNKAFLKSLSEIFDQLDFFAAAKKRMQIVEGITSSINSCRGTADSIIANLSGEVFNGLKANETYISFIDHLSAFLAGMSDFEQFSLFYQILYLRRFEKVELRKAIERSGYEVFLDNYNANLRSLDSTWKGIKAVESEGKLVVKYPQADEISNGQRDVLTLVSQLIAFSSKITTGKKFILIIDEVFDYLDDANTIAAQYYLSSFLKKHKGNIYLCIMTHLNPYTFRNYIFNNKLVNNVYLNENVPAASNAMMAFIAFRQGLDRKGSQEQSDLYDNLSRDLFHFNPVKVDYSAQINKIGTHRDLKSTWGKTDVLHAVLIEETNKYLSGVQSYDPYAVAIALRLRIEKILYEKLPIEIRNEFVTKKMTKNKFEFCEGIGIDIPDAYNIINAIHNEADHLSFNETKGEFEEKTMVYKLQNNVVLNIVRRIYGWRIGLSIDVTYIE